MHIAVCVWHGIWDDLRGEPQRWGLICTGSGKMGSSMDADKHAQATQLMEQLADLLASAENEDGSFKTFDQMELHANAIGDRFSTLLAQKSLQRNVDCKSQTPRCPKCDQLGCGLNEPDPRVIQTTRGQVQWNEDEYFCRKCRKSFFPSDQSVGFKG